MVSLFQQLCADVDFGNLLRTEEVFDVLTNSLHFFLLILSWRQAGWNKRAKNV
jgi:hypothetical protein